MVPGERGDGHQALSRSLDRPGHSPPSVLPDTPSPTLSQSPCSAAGLGYPRSPALRPRPRPPPVPPPVHPRPPPTVYGSPAVRGRTGAPQTWAESPQLEKVPKCGRSLRTGHRSGGPAQDIRESLSLLLPRAQCQARPTVTGAGWAGSFKTPRGSGAGFWVGTTPQCHPTALPDRPAPRNLLDTLWTPHGAGEGLQGVQQDPGTMSASSAHPCPGSPLPVPDMDSQLFHLSPGLHALRATVPVWTRLGVAAAHPPTASSPRSCPPRPAGHRLPGVVRLLPTAQRGSGPGLLNPGPLELSWDKGLRRALPRPGPGAGKCESGFSHCPQRPQTPGQLPPPLQLGFPGCCRAWACSLQAKGWCCRHGVALVAGPASPAGPALLSPGLSHLLLCASPLATSSRKPSWSSCLETCSPSPCCHRPGRAWRPQAALRRGLPLSSLLGQLVG